MTTDETRDQSGNTPEYVVQEAIYEHDDSWDLNEHIVAALRNEGMLAEGAPADEQVEAATWALIESDTDTSDRGVSDEHYRERRADVERVAPILRAGAAPPAPSDEREMLITSLRRVAAVLEEYEFEDHASEAAGLMNSAAEALAAPAPVDEAKLAEVVDNAQRRWNGSGRWEPIASAITRDVLALLRGDRR